MKALLIFAVLLCVSPIRGQSIEKADPRDAAVLKCVLTNLLTHPDFPVYRKDYRHATNIALLKLTPQKLGFSWTQMKVDTGGRVPLEEFQNMLARNSTPVTNEARQLSFEGFDFGPNVVLLHRDQIERGRGFDFYKRHPGEIGWIETFLPGYSKDGKHALVRAWKGPSSHGANVTAYLEKKDNHWSIVWLKITYWL